MGFHLPPLSTLRLFEAAGRRLNFREAADELHVTPSAVSHGIQTLEEWLGTPLFQRNPRGLSLTPAGSAYLPYVRDALQLLADGIAALPDRPQTRRVQITATPTFALRCLVPRLAAFRALHPTIEVTVDTSKETIDLPHSEFDLAIRLAQQPGDPSWPLLLREQLVPVCSPAYLDGVLGGNPEDFVERCTLIRLIRVTEDWDRWLAGAGVKVPRRAAELRFDNVQMVIAAAERGLGVAIGRLPLVARELSAGTLVPLSDQRIETVGGYWIVRRDASARRPEVRAFEDWLVDLFAHATIEA